MQTATTPTGTRQASPSSRHQIEEWLGSMADGPSPGLTAHLMCPAGQAGRDTILCMVDAKGVSPAVLAQRTGGLVFGADLVVCLLPWTPDFDCPRRARQGACDCTLAVGARLP